MATNIPYADYGVPTVQHDAFTQVELFAGDTPLVVTDYGVVTGALSSSGIPAWTPVVVDPETRAISLAEYGQEANAITVVSLQPNAPANSKLPVYKAGCFNYRSLYLYASYENAALIFATLSAITVVTLQPNAPAITNLPDYKAGCFNIRALNWDASYDTDAKKFAAFAAATDAQIYIKAPYGQ